MSIVTNELTPLIGTEIKASKDDLLSGQIIQKLRDLLELRGVLLFRELNLTNEEQRAFAATLGEVIPQGIEGVYNISLDPTLNDTADYLFGSFHWHIDGTTDDIPTRASFLTARTLWGEGDYTEFANTFAAYEELPDDMKRRIDKLRVLHSQEFIQRAIYPDPTDEQLARWHEHPAKRHPLVWTHRSGRKSLVLGLTCGPVEGMDAEAGRALLQELMDWATQPQFVYRHFWTPGDLLIWDNTGVMHRARPYPADSGRLLSRTTLAGEEALA